MSDEIKLTEWYLVRHAPAKYSSKGIYKEADVPAELPTETVIQALAATLPDDADCYVSPLSRARATATALQRAKGQKHCAMRVQNTLTEQDFGAWQGMAFEEIWEQVKDFEAHNWSLLAASTQPPNGESFADVYRRVTEFINLVSQENPSRPKILVTHAGIIRAFVGVALGLSPDRALALDARPFSLTRLLHQTGQGKGGQWQLQCMNQTFDDI